MKYLLLALFLLPNVSLACGGSSHATYVDMSVILILTLVGLAALAIPVSIFLINDLMTLKSIFIVLICSVAIAITAVVLMSVGSRQYFLEPIGIALLGIGLFIPYAMLLVRAIMRNRQIKHSLT